MSAEANKILAIQYYSHLNGEPLTTIEELFAPDYTMTIGSYPEVLRGHEGFKLLVTMMRSALPDLHFSLKNLISGDDIVVGHWQSSGTHTGSPFITAMGALPGEGQQFNIHGVSWIRIADGKIAESHVYEDAIGLLKQLGGLPAEKAPTHLAPKDETEAVIHRYFNEVMSQGKLELIDDLVTSDFALTILTLPEPIRGKEGLKQFVTRLRGAIPDLAFTVDRVTVEGNYVTARWKNGGMQTGTFLGAPATNKYISDQGVDIFHLVDGKIAELAIYEHDLQLMQQLGVIEVVPVPAYS